MVCGVLGALFFMLPLVFIILIRDSWGGLVYLELVSSSRIINWRIIDVNYIGNFIWVSFS